MATTAAVDANQLSRSEQLVYLWEDWVVLYLKEMRDTLNESIPINERWQLCLLLVSPLRIVEFHKVHSCMYTILSICEALVVLKPIG